MYVNRQFDLKEANIASPKAFANSIAAQQPAAEKPKSSEVLASEIYQYMQIAINDGFQHAHDTEPYYLILKKYKFSQEARTAAEEIKDKLYRGEAALRRAMDIFTRQDFPRNDIEPLIKNIENAGDRFMEARHACDQNHRLAFAEGEERNFFVTGSEQVANLWAEFTKLVANVNQKVQQIEPLRHIKIENFELNERP